MTQILGTKRDRLGALTNSWLNQVVLTPIASLSPPGSRKPLEQIREKGKRKTAAVTPLTPKIGHLLPTKFARDESRSLPRPLLAAEAVTAAAAEGAAG